MADYTLTARGYKWKHFKFRCPRPHRIEWYASPKLFINFAKSDTRYSTTWLKQENEKLYTLKNYKSTGSIRRERVGVGL